MLKYTKKCNKKLEISDFIYNEIKNKSYGKY